MADWNNNGPLRGMPTSGLLKTPMPESTFNYFDYNPLVSDQKCTDLYGTSNAPTGSPGPGRPFPWPEMTPNPPAGWQLLRNDNTVARDVDARMLAFGPDGRAFMQMPNGLWYPGGGNVANLRDGGGFVPFDPNAIPETPGVQGQPQFADGTDQISAPASAPTSAMTTTAPTDGYQRPPDYQQSPTTDFPQYTLPVILPGDPNYPVQPAPGTTEPAESQPIDPGGWGPTRPETPLKSASQPRH